MLILWALTAITVQADEPPKSNMHILQSIYVASFDSILSNVPLPDSILVLRLVNVDSSIKWLINSQLANYLQKQKKKHVFVNAKDSLQKRMAAVDCRPLQQSIIYNSLNSKLAKRVITVEIILSLYAADGELLVLKTDRHTSIDTLRKKDISFVENSAFPLTIGKTTKKFWSRATEPFFVSVVTGFIIYLFYSYRSK